MMTTITEIPDLTHCFCVDGPENGSQNDLVCLQQRLGKDDPDQIPEKLDRDAKMDWNPGAAARDPRGVK